VPGTVRVARRSRPWDRLPITKARPPGQAAFRPAGKLTLSKREKRLADLLTQAAAGYPLDLWTSPLTGGNIADTERRTREHLAGFERQIAGILADQYEASAERAARELADILSAAFRRARKAVRKEAPDPAELVAGFRFDARNANTAAWSRTEAARLVTALTETQRETVRQVIQQSFDFQRTPQQAARSLFEVLDTVAPTTTAGQEFAELIGARVNGLTPRYEQAVVNRAERYSADLAARGIEGPKALDKVRRDADKYAERLRRSRARTIARTEILTANNAGRMASFEQAQQRGLLSEEHSRKRWSASGFDMCPICTSLDGQLQRLKDPFVDEVSVDYPPAHPNCRCSFDIEPNVELWEPPRIVGEGTSDDPHRWATDPIPTPRFRQGAATPLPDRVPPSPGGAGPGVPVRPARGLVEGTQRQARLAEAAAEYGVTPEEAAMFLDDAAVLFDRAKAEAAERLRETFALLDSPNMGTTGIPDPRDVDKAGQVYYDWFRNLGKKEQQRLRQNGWVSRSVRASVDEFDEAFAAQFGLESRGLPGQALEEHWLRLNREHDLLAQAVRGRKPRNYDRYGITPDYNQLLPALRAEGYDLNVVIGGYSEDIAAMIAQKELVAGADEAYALIREADRAIHGPPPWRMSYQSWEDEVRQLESDARNGLLTSTGEARLSELVPPRVDLGQDYEELFATIVETARFARLEVAEYAVIPWQNSALIPIPPPSPAAAKPVPRPAPKPAPKPTPAPASSGRLPWDAEDLVPVTDGTLVPKRFVIRDGDETIADLGAWHREKVARIDDAYDSMLKSQHALSPEVERSQGVYQSAFGMHGTINGALREGARHELLDLHLANLDELFQTKIPVDVQLWRGMNIAGKKEFETLMEIMQEGAIVSDAGFMSTSVSQSTAFQFAGYGGKNKPVLMEIRARSGSTSYRAIEGIGGTTEHEVLLPRNVQLRVLENFTDENGVTRIVLEVVEDQ